MGKGLKTLFIFGLIKKLFVYIFKFLYIIIKFLNLQLAVLVALIGLLLYITGKLEGGALATIFYILLVLSLFYAIIKTIQSILFPKSKKEKNTRKVEIVDTKETTTQTTVPPVSPVPPVPPVPPTQTTVPPVPPTQTAVPPIAPPTDAKYPQYFVVKQNPKYIMAEFSDRYELYEKTAHGLVKVRTDPKS